MSQKKDFLKEKNNLSLFVSVCLNLFYVLGILRKNGCLKFLTAVENNFFFTVAQDYITP